MLSTFNDEVEKKLNPFSSIPTKSKKHRKKLIKVFDLRTYLHKFLGMYISRPQKINKCKQRLRE